MLLYAYFTPKVDFKRKFHHHQSFLYEWRLTARTIRKFRIGPSIRIESRIGRTIRNRIESRSFAGPYALQYSPCSLDPMPAATLRRISMKALARYQVIYNLVPCEGFHATRPTIGSSVVRRRQTSRRCWTGSRSQCTVGCRVIRNWLISRWFLSGFRSGLSGLNTAWRRCRGWSRWFWYGRQSRQWMWGLLSTFTSVLRTYFTMVWLWLHTFHFSRAVWAYVWIRQNAFQTPAHNINNKFASSYVQL